MPGRAGERLVSYAIVDDQRRPRTGRCPVHVKAHNGGHHGPEARRAPAPPSIGLTHLGRVHRPRGSGLAADRDRRASPHAQATEATPMGGHGDAGSGLPGTRVPSRSERPERPLPTDARVARPSRPPGSPARVARPGQPPRPASEAGRSARPGSAAQIGLPRSGRPGGAAHLRPPTSGRRPGRPPPTAHVGSPPGPPTSDRPRRVAARAAHVGQPTSDRPRRGRPDQRPEPAARVRAAGLSRRGRASGTGR